MGVGGGRALSQGNPSRKLYEHNLFYRQIWLSTYERLSQEGETVSEAIAQSDDDRDYLHKSRRLRACVINWRGNAAVLR